MSKVSARWVPRLLTPDQKLTRLILSHANLAVFEADQASFLDCFLTQDECWVHHSEPETKRQSMQWKHPGSPSLEGKSRFLSREGDDNSFSGKGHWVHRRSYEKVLRINDLEN